MKSKPIPVSASNVVASLTDAFKNRKNVPPPDPNAPTTDVSQPVTYAAYLGTLLVLKDPDLIRRVREEFGFTANMGFQTCVKSVEHVFKQDAVMQEWYAVELMVLCTGAKDYAITTNAGGNNSIKKHWTTGELFRVTTAADKERLIAALIVIWKYSGWRHWQDYKATIGGAK